jgi:hypothetical protein
MLACLMTEIAAIVYTVAGRFRQMRAGDGGRVLGVGLPFIGLVVLATVLWYNVKGPQDLWTSPACAGAGVVGYRPAGRTAGAPRMSRMRSSLAMELGAPLTTQTPREADQVGA